MKNKPLLLLLSFLVLMMVSGISFAMKNIETANNLPIVLIQSFLNNKVAIVRSGDVSGQPKNQMEIVNFNKKTRRIKSMVSSDENIDKEGIKTVFGEVEKLMPKSQTNEKYEQAKSQYNKYIKNNERSSSFTGEDKEFFTPNWEKNCIAYYGPDCVVGKSAVGIYLVGEYKDPEVFFYYTGVEVTAVAFGKNNELLIGRTDNILEKVPLSYVEENGKKVVKYNLSSRENYDLSTFEVLTPKEEPKEQLINSCNVVAKDDLNSSGLTEDIQKETKIKEGPTPKEEPNSSWAWTLPKMRIVMLSGICLTVALLLYSQYFSRMSA